MCRDQLTKVFGRAYKDQIKRHPFYGFQEGMNPRKWWEELVYDTFISAGVPKTGMQVIEYLVDMQ